MTMDTGNGLDVLSVGNFCVDLLIRPVQKLPEPGGLELIDDYSLQTGGCGNNAAIAMSRLGLRVACVGRIGQDRTGEIVLEELRKNRVLVNYMARDDTAHTSLSVVTISANGERSFFHHPGANWNLKLGDVPQSVFAQSRLLHVGGAFLFPKLDGEPLAALLCMAKQAGCFTAVDTAVDGKGNKLAVIAAALPYMDYFLPSEAEASGMTGLGEPEAMAAALLAQGAGTVCIKLGARGCYVANRQEGRFMPAYQVRPLDTCGAGDTFTGGFIAGLLRGRDPFEAAQVANAVGAMCVTAIGATTAIGNWEETLAFMNQTPLH